VNKLHTDGAAHLLNTLTQHLNYNGHELSFSDHCQYARVFLSRLWSNYNISTACIVLRYVPHM